MFTEVQRLQGERNVRSVRTVATAVSLTPPEHMPITSVVMAIAQTSVSHTSTVQIELTELHYINGC